MGKKRITTRNICTVLLRKLGQRTVLGVAVPILEGHVRAMKNGQIFEGMTARQVERGFKDLSHRFLNSDFHSTYMVRPLGERGFLERIDDRFRIRSTLLVGLTITELENLLQELLDSLQSAYEKRQAIIREIERTNELPGSRLQERCDLVSRYLSQLRGNRGETFEVVSFAILREYFKTFGFSLQRFSTTHANDGGMDFVGGEAIYQVSVDSSLNKVKRDLQKSPGTKRVLVRPSLTGEIAQFGDTQILEMLDLEDLLNHFISWLFARDSRSKQPRHLEQVLRVALEELRRENRAERVSNAGT